MANGASTLPCDEKTRGDQQAHKEWDKTRSREVAHNGSLAMSATITASPLYAAVPQEPADGPTTMPLMASAYAFGRLGAPPCRKRSPSNNKMDAKTPLPCSSTSLQRLSSI